ncbi:MAG TPA: ribonuclease PH [Phycisphaerae bacterium]|nr:ribonuclease PH [Phycisphaerae bacterium]
MATGKRQDGRRANELRPVKVTPGFVRSADGSCLFEIGRTRVICTASFVAGVPKWREGSALGWVTAEYGMLPASTPTRKPRPALKSDSRATEIQRLIGRVLRNVVRFEKLGANTVYLDCDVLEADGGTRTAAINGAYVALAGAIRRSETSGRCARGALARRVAAVSVGIVDRRAVLDMDYAEDSAAEVDMNVAMIGGGRFVEIQGSSEGEAFTFEQLDRMLRLARSGIRKVMWYQQQAVSRSKP